MLKVWNGFSGAVWFVLLFAWLYVSFAFTPNVSDALIMIPASLSPSGKALTFEGRCELSRVFEAHLECRAIKEPELEYRDIK